MDDVYFRRENKIGLITLNRGSALNALTLRMISAMQEQLIAWEMDESIQAIIVRASAGKAFCAGGDVRWLYQQGEHHTDKQMQFFWHEYRLNHSIHQLKKPYIALMDGITMGGGVGISLHGSHPIATERFLFAMPETSIGFFPDVGVSYLLSRLSGQFGLFLGLAGTRLNGNDACALGLAKHYVPSSCIDALFGELVALDFSRDAHECVNSCIQSYQITIDNAPVSRMESLIENAFAKEGVEDILKALAAGNDKWQQDCLTTMNKLSPLSLKITFRLIQKAKEMSLGDCLKMDYRIANHFMADHDFYEGVRALLIEKDNAPHWDPKTLEDVSACCVDQYFNSSEKELSLLI